MLRIATEADVPSMLNIYAPYILTSTITFEYDVPSEAAFLERFRQITARFPWLVWEEEGRVLGYAYASPPYQRAAYSWCAEDSLYLLPEARERGLGTRLLNALEALLKLQGYQVIYAIVTQENEASMAFHQKLGYHPVACFPSCGFKFGRWLSVNWLEKRLTSVEIPSQMPVPWPDVRQDAEKIGDILDKLTLS